MTATFAPAAPIAPVDKGLKSGALGLVSSIVIGVSSTAPAYSLAATIGLVAAAVGLQSPAVMLLSFVPMLLIAYAYRELNALDPDCGTTFTWATRAFGPRTGWMGGWGILVSDVVVMADLAQIAGQYGFLLVGADGLAASKVWTTLVGSLWIVALTYVCYRGINVSAQLQYVLLGIEMAVLIVFSVVALAKVYSGHAGPHAVHPSLGWLNPFDISSFSALSAGVLLAVFIYWGWDSTVSVNEETTDAAHTPGRAAIVSTLVLLAVFVLVTGACQAYGGVAFLASPDNNGDVLAALGNQVLGSTLGKVLILAVLSSAAASTQTTILPTARTTLSMGVQRALPRSFARMHPRFQTPTTSTIAMGAMSIAFYVGLVLISGNVLEDSIDSIGLMIAFYYALTGFASAWIFRHDMRTAHQKLVRGVLPFLGGAILTAAFVKSAHDMFNPNYGETSFDGVGGVFLLGIGSLLLGVVVMVVCELTMPAFFRRGRNLIAAGPVDPETGAAWPIED